MTATISESRIEIIGSPNSLHISMRNILQNIHHNEFGWYMSDIHRYWWLLSYAGDEISGMAGARQEGSDTIYLGPCVVLPAFRGQGLQGRFIRKREEIANTTTFRTNRIIACTHRHNHASANNFIRAGYLLVRPRNDFEKINDMLCWEKKI